MTNIRNQNETYLNSLELRQKGSVKCVFTKVDIPKGAILAFMQGDIQDFRDKHSIQVDENKHLGKSGMIDDELCHACDANARIDFSDLSIRAKRDLKAGEEVAINYCASEEVSANPFHCFCGSKSCYGYVNGFKNLTAEQRLALKDDISPFLKKKYQL